MKRDSTVDLEQDGLSTLGWVLKTRQGHHILVEYQDRYSGKVCAVWLRKIPAVRHQRNRKKYRTFAGHSGIPHMSSWLVASRASYF